MKKYSCIRDEARARMRRHIGCIIASNLLHVDHDMQAEAAVSCFDFREHLRFCSSDLVIALSTHTA